MNSAKLDSGRLVQGLILFGLNIYLIKILASGDVYKLLSPLAANLLMVTVVMMVIMMAYCLITSYKKETSHAHAHDHEHACSHDHSHDHHHACGHDHSHDHVHSHDHDHSDCGHDHDHNPKPRLAWAILAAPMVLGLAMPTQALDTSMMKSGLQVAPAQVQLTNAIPADDSTTSSDTQPAATQQPTATQTSTATQPQKQDDAKKSSTTDTSSYKTDFTKAPRTKGAKPAVPNPDQELKMTTMLNDITLAPEYFYDHRFKFVGMVYHPDGFPMNRFVLLRYMIAHCSADSTAIGLVVETNDATNYKNDQWVEIDATVTLKKAPEFDRLPPIAWFQGYPYKPMLISHDIKTIDQPEHPYLYSTFKI